MGKLKNSLIDEYPTFDEIDYVDEEAINDLGIKVLLHYEDRNNPVLILKKPGIIRYYGLEPDTLALSDILL